MIYEHWNFEVQICKVNSNSYCAIIAEHFSGTPATPYH